MRVGSAAVLLLLLCAVALTGQRTTGAAWSDTAAVTSGELVAHTVVSQAPPACAEQGGGAQLTWTKPDTRHEYLWQVRRSSSQELLASGTVGAEVPAGGTVGLPVPPPPLLALPTNLDVVVRARVAGSAWIASSATTSPVRLVSLLVVGLVTRCGHF